MDSQPLRTPLGMNCCIPIYLCLDVNKNLESHITHMESIFADSDTGASYKLPSFRAKNSCSCIGESAT
jgi:hypothetical protein